jgi:redox-sensitive bicupin YhaK (pirin superfamily)
MIELVISQRRRDLGGFEVGRVLPFAKRRMVGPFVFFDHMGPVDFPPGLPRSVDVRPHPHIGLATLTYLFDGEIMHRDSVGSEQPIRPGEVNWMTAGRGITHSERFERARREGGRMDGIQAWVALPRELEETDPAFSHHVAVQSDENVRLIAGEAFGDKSPVPVHSPLFYLHCDLQAGARVELPAQYAERAAYVASGAIEVDGQRIEAGQMAVFAAGNVSPLRALGDSVVMLLGGEPLGERFIEWNFVSSSRERIEQAKADWRAGRMKLPDLDNAEFIPLPEPAPPPNPMS